ncbi:MAG: caspase family protein [Phycisphaerales bacterium]
MQSKMQARVTTLGLVLAAGLAVGGAWSAGAQQDKSLGGSLGDPQKLTAAKSGLGLGDSSRTIRGELNNQDRTLDDGSRYDPHLVPLVAGQTVVLTLRSRRFDPYLILLDATGEQVVKVAEDDNSAGGTWAQVRYTAPRTGRYVVLANGARADDAGEYELTVVIEDAQPSEPSLGAANRFDRTGVFRGELEPGVDDTLDDGSLIEPVFFEGRRGEVIEISVSSDDFDTVLGFGAIVDGRVEFLAGDDDSGFGSNSLLRIRLPYTGEYVAFVNAFGAGESGSYELRVNPVQARETAMPAQNWAAMYPGGGNPDETYVLLVGIDDYPGSGNDLASCVNDTQRMADVCSRLLGVPASNIVVLNDEQATREHILEATQRHLGQAGEDGTAVFYFSGHGTQADGNYARQDAESDGRDEALFVWGLDTSSSFILDDELGALLGGLEAGRRLAILDACHSGTGTLGAGQIKWVDLNSGRVRPTFEAPKEFLDMPAAGAEIPSDHLLLSASRADQVAMAGPPGHPSVFTGFLVAALEQHGTQITFGELMDIVQQMVDRERRANAAIIQIPQIEGVREHESVAEFFRPGGAL